MEGYVNLSFEAQEPYPPVRAEGRNQKIGAAILDNVGGGNSEISAVAMYVYDHLVTHGLDEVAEAFHKISIVEMHHLEIFGTLALQLGEDPRLWGVNQGRKSWWSPGYLSYPRQLGPLLRYAVREEKASIRKYRAQARWIPDQNVTANLRRIVADEERHLEVLTELYDTYVGGGFSGPPPSP